MAAHWIDRLARAAAGTQVRRAEPLPAGTGEPSFSRETALKSAAVFGLTTAFAGLRPTVAPAADSCVAKCEAETKRAAIDVFTKCLGGVARVSSAQPHLFLPSLLVSGYMGCSVMAGMGRLVVDTAECRPSTANGKCEWDDPNAPKPRTLDRPYPPPKPADPNPRGKKPPPPKKKPPGKPPKQPPKQPTDCGLIKLPPNAVCCPEPSVLGGFVPCRAEAGCKKVRGCCDSIGGC